MAVCCLDEPGAWASELTEMRIPVTSLGRERGFNPELGRRIAALAREQGANVLHCHHYSPFVYGAVARLWQPLRVVFTEHGRAHDGPPSWKRKVANQVFGRLPASIHAVSKDLKQHLVKEGFTSDRIDVIYNGIDPGVPPTRAQRDAARAALGCAHSELLIGAVGRLDPVKDLPTLLEAFETVASAHGTARLVLIGEGPERARLERLIDERDLGERVTLAGYRRDVRALLPALDVYVNSSIFEGVSLTILEAMAAGLPVVATSVGGTPEVVSDGVTGRLVPARQPTALADAISTILSNRTMASSLASHGRIRLEQRFSLGQMVQSYAAVYNGETARPCVA
jgi:glycosyltransferase involved in cell wall biosynthesis